MLRLTVFPGPWNSPTQQQPFPSPSMSSASIHRRLSRQSDEPYVFEPYLDQEELPKTLTPARCVEMYRERDTEEGLPSSCGPYIERFKQLKQAYEGMGGNAAARAAAALEKNSHDTLTHAQLQRRYTRTK